MKKAWIILVSFLTLLALAGCVTDAASDAALTSRAVSTRNPPVVIYWAKASPDYQNLTHIANRVWVGTQEDNPDDDPAYHRDAWLERGVTPLDWAPGKVEADRGVEGLADKWSGSLRGGHVGIAIDEFGSRDREEDRILSDALLELRSRFPDRYLAVWHAGLLHDGVVEAYQEAADLIMIESYVSGGTLLGPKFWWFLRSVRARGLEHKTVPVVAVGDERWAATVEEAEAQIRHLRENASDFAGIGFYAPDASVEMMLEVDRLVAEIYGDWR